MLKNNAIPNEKIKLTAIHEAAHAVAAVIVKRKFKYVCIIPNEKDNSLGHIRYSTNNKKLIKNIEGFSYTMSQKTIENRVRRNNIISLAGYVAELKLGVENSTGAKDDFERVVDFCIGYGGDSESAQELADESLASAKELVDENWKAIETVAAALLKEKKLPYDAVLQLVEANLK